MLLSVLSERESVSLLCCVKREPVLILSSVGDSLYWSFLDRLLCLWGSELEYLTFVSSKVMKSCYIARVVMESRDYRSVSNSLWSPSRRGLKSYDVAFHFTQTTPSQLHIALRKLTREHSKLTHCIQTLKQKCIVFLENTVFFVSAAVCYSRW